MSKRRELEGHRKQLIEIRDIMNSMKNLAYLETRKLSSRLTSQKKAILPIEKAAADLLQFNPQLRPLTGESKPIILLIGSERGFCGDYNDALLKYVDINDQDNADVIIIGDKLAQRLEQDGRVIATLAGANTTDEIGDILNRIVDLLAKQQVFSNRRPFKAVYHDSSAKEILMKSLLPSFAELLVEEQRYANIPDTNLSPSVLLNEIAEHHLLALLHKALYTALMAENLSRIDHMENALQRLDEKTTGLSHQFNALRQEEIIEEIEIILLNAKLAGKRHAKNRAVGAFEWDSDNRKL